MHDIQAHKGMNSCEKNDKGFFYPSSPLKVMSVTQGKVQLCQSYAVVELAELK